MPERSTASTPPPPARVPGNRWDLLRPAEVGATAAVLPVSVVVTSAADLTALRACLTALAAQSYPAHLLQVIVTPTGPTPDVEVADVAVGSADVVVVPAPSEPGPTGLARNRGAEAADGSVLVFLDGGVVLDPVAVEAHARWHHVAGDVVTLGTDDAEQAVAASAPGVFRAVSGANVAVSTSTFSAVGGFAGLMPPAVDELEFGYRLHNAGCVFVPEARAAGKRTGSAPTAGSRIPDDSVAALRLAAVVPAPGVRESVPGRSYVVPRTVVHVPVSDEPVAIVGRAVEAVLAGNDHDVSVRVSIPSDHEGQPAIAGRFLGDPRVEVTAEPARGWPSTAAHQVWAPPGVVVSRHTVQRLAAVLETGRSGAVHLTVPDRDPADLRVHAVATRALARAGRLAADGDPYPIIGELFGEEWHSGADFGVDRVDRAAGPPPPPAVPPDVPLDPERLLGLLGRAEEQRFNAEQRLTRELAESEGRCRELEARVDRLRADRDSARGRVDRLRADRDSARGRVEQLETRLETDRQRYRRRIEKLEADRETLRNRLAQAQAPPPGVLRRALRLARSPGRVPEAVGRRLGARRRKGQKR